MSSSVPKVTSNIQHKALEALGSPMTVTRYIRFTKMVIAKAASIYNIYSHLDAEVILYWIWTKLVPRACY